MSEPSTTSSAGPSQETAKPPPAPWRFWKRISLRTKRRARRRIKAAADRALGALARLLAVAGDAANDTGVPGLAGALSAVRVVIEKIQLMKTTVEGAETLCERVVSLTHLVEGVTNSREGEQVSNGTLEQIAALSATWTEIAQQAGDIKSSGRIKRFFSSTKDAKRLEELVERISTSIQDEILRGVLNMKEDMHAIRRDAGAIHEDVKVILGDSLMKTYAKNAQYDAGGVPRRPCLEGTRVDVLERLHAWINAARNRTAASPEAGSVFWINGLAGTGKTTIAFSVAEWSDKQGFLAANFFCSHSDAECSDPNLIFPTLSRQLCSFHAPFREKAAAVLRAKPDLVHAGPLRQFEELIVKPLEAVKDTFPTSVIVLDALDECVDKEATSTILTAIARFIHRIAGLVLFVVTSRPERRITAMFDKAATDTLRDVTTPLLLHQIELESVLNDVRRFLEDGFARHSRFFVVEEGWPAQQDVNKLAELSGGLFIWAATALLFIMDRAYCNPPGQLRSLLTLPSSSPHGNTILDFLYSQIANAAFSKIAPALSERLRAILGAVVVAQEPLSVRMLAGLVELSDIAVRNTLVGLSSVLHVPGSDSPAETIQIIHLTFPEFLLSSSPAKPEAFCISAADHHLSLFMRCMAVMRDLKRNIAGIESPCAFKSEIPDLAKKIKACISPLLGYAVRYWTTHLANCVRSAQVDSSFDAFREFLYSHYLHWLEACSLLGIIDGAVTAHYAVVQACQTLRGRFAGLLPFLVDCRRFALTYAACVDTAPLQLYYSALAVAPTRSLVRAAYEKDLSASLLVCRGARSEWAPCLDAFKGHGGEWVSTVAFKGHGREWVYAVAFSPSGNCFITGGGDSKLRMWRPSTRTMILSFEGHTHDVNCAAFSPDGVYVASGSADRDVRIWLVSSGECVQTLEGHTDGVWSVAYSADGRRLLSATRQGEVKLWDVSDGRCVLTLGPVNPTWQVGISADGTVIAYGHGASLTLYDTSSATNETIDFPDLVMAATFSSDGHHVAAMSRHAIRVWKVAGRSLVRSIDVPDDDLYGQLVFSRDGTHIACGSEQGSVYLWHVSSGAPPRILRGHTGCVFDVSWSPDGLQVVSVSLDSTIRVWDVTQSWTDAADVASQRPSPATGPVRFVLARHDGPALLLHLPSSLIDTPHFAALASALAEGAPALTPFADVADAWDAASQFSINVSDITQACAWAAVSGQQQVYLSASTLEESKRVSISPGGSLMAYLSSTSHSVVDICNLHAGNVVASLTGHTDDILSIAFSSDGTHVATGSGDMSVKVWNVTSGAMLYSYDEHTGWVHALAFSPDGHHIASGSSDQSVHVFETATGRVVQVFESHRNWVAEVAFTSANAHVLSLDWDNSLYIWDMATGINVYDISLTDDSWVRGLNFSPDGTGILIGHPEAHTLSLWDAASRTWPVYMVSKEGWVYAKSPGRTARSGWLPPEWRNPFSIGSGKFCVPDPSQKQVVVFNVSQLPEYVLV